MDSATNGTYFFPPLYSQVMVVGAVARQANYRQRYSRKQHRAQTGCRHRRRSRTVSAPAVSAHSCVEPPHQESDPPPHPPGGQQSSGWDMEEKLEDKTAATQPDQTQRSL